MVHVQSVKVQVDKTAHAKVDGSIAKKLQKARKGGRSDWRWSQRRLHAITCEMEQWHVNRRDGVGDGDTWYCKGGGSERDELD